MDSDLSKLIDDLAKLTKVEANFQKHSAEFLEGRDDILRAVHESCRIVSKKVHIRLADTGVCICHF